MEGLPRLVHLKTRMPCQQTQLRFRLRLADKALEQSPSHGSDLVVNLSISYHALLSHSHDKLCIFRSWWYMHVLLATASDIHILNPLMQRALRHPKVLHFLQLIIHVQHTLPLFQASV